MSKSSDECLDYYQQLLNRDPEYLIWLETVKKDRKTSPVKNGSQTTSAKRKEK